MTNARPDSDSFTEMLRSRIEKWLVDEGWQLELRDASGTSWNFVATDSNRRVVNIRLRLGKLDQVSLMGSVVLTPQDQRQLERLPESERNAFLWDLRFDVIRLGLDFMGIDFPLRRISVMQELYFDGGLSKDTFMQRLAQVRRGVALIQFHFWSRFGNLQLAGDSIEE